jgi:hypothetical protein
MSKLTQRIKRKTFQWTLAPEEIVKQTEIRGNIFSYTEQGSGSSQSNAWDNFCKKYTEFAKEVGISQKDSKSSNNSNNGQKIRKAMMKWKYQYNSKTVVAATKEYEAFSVNARTGKHQAAYRKLRNLFTRTDNNSNDTNNLSYRSKISKLVRGGVPPLMRGKIWEYCSGADLKRNASYAIDTSGKNNNDIHNASKPSCKIEAYHDILNGLKLGTINVAPQHLIDIDKDLNRTVIVLDNERAFPEELQNSLERILIAYCFRNPELGYCQGMSTLGALLLLHMDEEKSFWVLSCIVEDMLPRFYATNMIGIKTEAATFEFLVQTYLGKVYNCVGSFQTLKPFAIKWFLCLFVNSLPLSTVLRVWDVFFHEGVKVLHRVGLSALYLQQDVILKASKGKEMGPIFDGLDNATKNCTDANILFDTMYGNLFYGKNFSSKLLLKIRRHVISNDDFFFIAENSFYLKNEIERMELETLKTVTPPTRSGTSSCIPNDSSASIKIIDSSSSNNEDGKGKGNTNDINDNTKRSTMSRNPIKNQNSWARKEKH